MIGRVVVSLAVSLALTLVLESVFFLLFRAMNTNREKKDFKLLILVNVLTNPIVVLSFWLVSIYSDWNTNIAIIPLEFFAVIVEGLYYKKYGQGIKRPFLFSLGANAFSFGIGSLISIIL